MQQEVDYIKALRRCESESVGRVEKSKIFETAEPDHTHENHRGGLYQLGEAAAEKSTVKVRSGFQRFLSAMRAVEWQIGVLSLVRSPLALS